MFPRRGRLPREAFSSLGRAKRRTNAYFTALFPLGAGYAVVISKKTLARAVDRHRLKRRVLGSLRGIQAVRLPKALILYPKTSAQALTATEMRKALEELLRESSMP